MEALKVILDSNAFFVPLQFKIDIFEELKTFLPTKFEPILLSPIKRELETIAEKGSPKMRKLSSYALKLAEKCIFFEVGDKIAGCPDDAIIEMAKKWRCPVFTNDGELRKKLRNISVPVIYVRQKSHLEIDGRIQSSV
jgi:rRNA-processing protein FCF1